MNHYLIKTQQVRARDTSAGSKATMAEDGTPALDALQDPAVSVVSTDAQHQLLQASLAAEIAQLQAHVGQLNAKLGQAHAKNLQLSKKLGHNPHASFARRLDFVEKEIDSDNANDVRNLMLIVQTRLTGRQLMAHIAADAKEPDDPQLRAKWHAEQDEVSAAFMKAFDEPLMALLRVYKPMNAWACFDVLKQRHDCLPVKTEDEVKAEQQGLLLSVQRDSGKGMRGYLNAHDVLLARLLSARGTWVCDLSANDFRDNLRCILRGVDCDHDSFTQAARDVLIYQKNSFGARLDQLREASGPQLKDFKAELQLGLNQAWDRLQLSDKAPAPALPQDMVQMGLSQRVTTVNDQPAVYRCERCGSKSHTTRACEFKGSCNFCGNPGHMVSICRAKLRHDDHSNNNNNLPSSSRGSRDAKRHVGAVVAIARDSEAFGSSSSPRTGSSSSSSSSWCNTCLGCSSNRPRRWLPLSTLNTTSLSFRSRPSRSFTCRPTVNLIWALGLPRSLSSSLSSNNNFSCNRACVAGSLLPLSPILLAFMSVSTPTSRKTFNAHHFELPGNQNDCGYWCVKNVVS
jgi:hypothetical protein